MFHIDFDSKKVVEMLGDLQRKTPIVMRNALNDVAFEVMRELKDSLSKTFPSAKPQTKKNIVVHAAGKKTKFYDRSHMLKSDSDSIYASVFFDQIYNKGIDEYMLPNIDGGPREKKPSELRLGRYYVPGIGAKLDQYGNMQGGQITQILSRLGRFGDVAGYNMNSTSQSHKHWSRGSKNTEYFMITRPTGGLKPGIYMRTQKQGGFSSTAAPRGKRGVTGAFQKSSSGMIQARGAIPVVLFVKAPPKYKAVWPFFKQGEALANRLLPERIDYYVAQMLRR